MYSDAIFRGVWLVFGVGYALRAKSQGGSGLEIGFAFFLWPLFLAKDIFFKVQVMLSK